MEFTGKMFDGSSSTPKKVVVRVYETSKEIHVRTVDERLRFSFEQIDFLEPIGRKSGTLLCDRKYEIHLPDRNTHRALKKTIVNPSIWRRIDDIENSWPLILGCLALVLVFFISVFTVILPYAAKKIAFTLPHQVCKTIGERGLEQLKLTSLTDSEMSTEEQSDFREQFTAIVETNGFDPTHYKLHFHQSTEFGANAFALPSGDVVALDELFNIGLSNEEILAVFAHEIAHVEQRHGVQTLIRYAGVSALISIALGDLNTGTSLAVFIPKLLIEKGYSRAFETEADQFAVMYLRNIAIHPSNLITGLEKLIESYPNKSQLPTIISSHPDLEKRSQAIQKAIQETEY